MVQKIILFSLTIFVLYATFVYTVTHRGDFYHRRRWKAAAWLACIIGLLIMIIVALVFIFNTELNHFRQLGAILWFELLISPVIILMVFLFTLRIHSDLKWRLTSDDTLDKIWPDPNKGHKSPIQPF